MFDVQTFVLFCIFYVNGILNWETGTPNLPNCNKNGAGGYNSDTNTIWIFGGKCGGNGTNWPNIFSYNIDTQQMSSHGYISPFKNGGFELWTTSYYTMNNIVYIYYDKQIHSFNMDTQEYKINITSNIPKFTQERNMIIVDANTLIIYDAYQGMYILESELENVSTNATWNGPYTPNIRHEHGCGVYSDTGYIYLFAGKKTSTIERIDINDLNAGFSYTNSAFQRNIKWMRCLKVYDTETNHEIVYTLGGHFSNETRSPLNHVYKYDINDDILIRDTNMNSIRENGVGFVVNNILYYFGGEDGSDENNDWGTGARTFIFAELPTKNPTTLPTNIPTNLPTNIPTNLPINRPSFIPTNEPSTSPTVTPTNIPTLSTTNPTVLPTYIHTLKPMKKPDKKPDRIQDNNDSAMDTIFKSEAFLIGSISGVFGCVIFCLVIFFIHLLRKRYKKEAMQDIQMINNAASPTVNNDNKEQEGQIKKKDKNEPGIIISDIVTPGMIESPRNEMEQEMNIILNADKRVASVDSVEELYEIVYNNKDVNQTQN